MDEATLKFLIHSSSSKTIKNVDKTIKASDRKFYKKRVLYLTNELLNNKKNPQILEHGESLVEAFQQYLATCISYFKHLDTHDICQEEYKDLKEEEEEDKDDDLKEDWREKDKAIMLSLCNNSQKKVMKQFLSISKKEENEKEKEKEKEETTKIFVPLKKKIKLKTEELKTKGIIKKEKKIIQQDNIDEQNETNKETENTENTENTEKPFEL